MKSELTIPSSPVASAEIAVEPFIGKAEVARRMNKTLRTVDNWMARGILPYYKIGRSVGFKWSEIESHLAQTCRVSCRTEVRAALAKSSNLKVQTGNLK